MKGYLIHGKGFIPAEEWYDTGDVVDVDEAGYISIKSRLKRFAKIGGEMVSLNQVEEIAAQCFNTPSIAAVSISDARKGEKLILFSTTPELKAEMLRDYIGKHGFSALLMPAKLAYLDKIPLLGSGKTDYVRLKQLAEVVN
jgi:acyl-[acyl-carrier-protein]-phospholipid O-acyltransferase/long-chain-fatty-acid--[acyl-carrier-protein] ligase